MTSSEFQALLEKYSRNECTPEEEQLINEWYESIGTAETQSATADIQESESRIWANINPDRNPASPLFIFAKIAAAIVGVAMLVAVIINFLPQKQTSLLAEDRTPSQPPQTELFQIVANNTSSVSILKLPDGSTVRLKPKSEIKYEKRFHGTTREVFLIGEAFFDVHRDVNRPFRVYSAEVVTQVLGTSFNVKAWSTDKMVTVAVKSGKVSVFATPATSHKESPESFKTPFILAPNQQAVYNRTEEKIVREVVAKPEIILPKSDLFRMNFDETPVGDIFDVLQENYGIAIEYDRDKLEKCTLTTAMSDEGLFERIDVICKAINAKYQVIDGKITIESPGCE